ncbi:MAG: membrane-bound PQQ-dependent dehydrogenase, glucose/quinate/shikimate family [Sphingomonadales bacterium]
MAKQVAGWIATAFAGLLLVAIGGMLLWWGTRLVMLGGSPYYALAGIAILVSGALFLLRRRSGYWLYLVTVVATFIWAIIEVGLDRWGLMARLLAPIILLLLLTAIATLLRPRIGSRSLVALAAVQIVLLGAGWFVVRDTAPTFSGSQDAVATADPVGWANYGGDWRADHFSSAAQITPANAPRLQRAWTYRVGGMDDLGTNSRFTATPLAIGDTLYLCNPRNIVVALDSATGRERWRHDPKVDASKVFSVVCRGVSYHAGSGSEHCASRILEATLDARLIAIDARDGKPCAKFGQDGAVDLRPGVQPRDDHYYYVTSPPAILDDLAILGGYVIDNQRIDAPHSVIRAFDVKTGALRWTWDAGAHPDAPKPPPDGLFTPGNPNAWTSFSIDPALGLVYIPTGNSSPDFFGGLRTPAAEKFGTSIVALDARAGTLRWSFQTVHHDLWDYDMPAEPALVDMPDAAGRLVPALVGVGKTGEVFLLDRRTGKPISPVEERAVPRSDVPGERAAATQPFSVGMPSFAPPSLRETDMWGATPIDMLMCRVRFRELRYEGAYTPPSTRESLFSPGTFGAINWGGVAIDRQRGLMIVNSSSMPFIGRLVPRKEADAEGAAPFDPAKVRAMQQAKGRPMPPMPMEGTPFGLRLMPFLSPLYFPCQAPPWGKIAAIDLKTRKLAWERPFGTTKGLAPFGLSLPVGIFNLGGAVTTASGVTFIGAATDGYLRAFQTSTGRELWRDMLPAGGQATPISYAARDGRQMVAIVAGGHGSLRTKRGDYVVAYALPSAMIRKAQ